MKALLSTLVIVTAAWLYVCFILVKGFIHEKIGHAIDRAVNTPLLQKVFADSRSHDSEQDGQAAHISVSDMSRANKSRRNLDW